MKLMTVKEYAAHIGKSIPLVYKQIEEGKLRTERRYGRILVRAKGAKKPEIQPIVA